MLLEKAMYTRIFMSIAILLASSLLFPASSFAQDDEIPVHIFTACDSEYSELMEVVEVVNQDGRTQYDYDDYERLKLDYQSCYGDQIAQLRLQLDRGSDAIKVGDYQQAINYYEQAKSLLRADTLGLETSIISMYLGLAWESYQRGEYTDVFGYLEEIDDYGPTRQQKFQLWYLRALYAASQDDYTNAQKYAERAQDFAVSATEREEIERYLDYVSNRAASPTNDPLSYQQPWLRQLHIREAAELIDDNSNEAIVAVIDNGVDTDHPDLAGRIRENSGEIPGNGIDDDGNGYVDDIHGYNFFADNATVAPYGDHGTQIAGIIGAISNNKLGVAGIVDDVKLMPLVVCDNKECLHSDYLSDPIRYAVDNGADIINMSLVSKNASFNPGLTEAIEYATDRGAIVVIAAGNGIGLDTNKTGIDTSKSLISPVCNEGTDKKRIVGVGAANQDGDILTWSNYGDCVDVYSFGEKIVTTSPNLVNEEGRYLIADGTSFAAPIIAGIITLGFNAVGQQPYSVVYDALIESSNDGIHPNAEEYVQELQKRYISPEDQQKISLLFYAIDRAYGHYLPARKMREYKVLLEFLDRVEPKLEQSNKRRKLTLLYAIREGLQQRLDRLK